MPVRWIGIFSGIAAAVGLLVSYTLSAVREWNEACFAALVLDAACALRAGHHVLAGAATDIPKHALTLLLLLPAVSPGCCWQRACVGRRQDSQDSRPNPAQYG